MGSVARLECVQRRVTVRVVASRRREPRLRRGQLVVLPLLVHVDLLRLGLLRLLLPLRHRLLLHLHLRGRGDLRTTRRQLQQLRNVPDRTSKPHRSACTCSNDMVPSAAKRAAHFSCLSSRSMTAACLWAAGSEISSCRRSRSSACCTSRWIQGAISSEALCAVEMRSFREVDCDMYLFRSSRSRLLSFFSFSSSLRAPPNTSL